MNECQILRGNSSDVVYSEPLKDITQIRHEIFRSLNLFMQFDRGASQNITNFTKWLFTYSAYAVDFQAFSVDEVEGVQDVKYDGFKTGSGVYARAQFKLAYYKNGKVQLSGAPTKPANIQMTAIQLYDWHVVYNPQKQKLYQSEQPIGTIVTE